MLFRLPHVPKADNLIDTAYREGAKKAKSIRSTKGPKERRIYESEIKRVEAAGKKIEGDLNAVVKMFPSYEQLPRFHQRLLEIQIDKDRYKKSLGAVDWCRKRVEGLRKETIREIKRNKDPDRSKKFLGRCASLVKQISEHLDTLIEMKKLLREFPELEGNPTLVVAGYPNVGKSTFVSTLTGSKVKIANYPFTTQSILVGHKNIRYQTYQIIDTPGLLDRPMRARNRIEQQAILSMEELANVILFLVDPDADLDQQMSLLKEIEDNFGADIYVAVNKADCAEKSRLDAAVKRFNSFSPEVISAKDSSDCDRLFHAIFRKKDA